ncbi:C-type lectin domain family 4 member E-like isoform X1 [Alligator sinensis]|uniref:C-type lectin domain family 4 member E-like isoform X1 n=1 Tax=Alligator sinensis TaxID=38654 RepID=A0A3Q0H9X5_ALLSI|nr:C-type lectin domain family 4 member E-like isoform X1 [Alligator sinensis]
MTSPLHVFARWVHYDHDKLYMSCCIFSACVLYPIKELQHWVSFWSQYVEQFGLTPGKEKGWEKRKMYSLLFSSPFPVVPHQQNCEEHKALPQNISEWLCAVRIAEEEERVWTCCPKGWKLFRTSCYYLSHDTARPWDASEKNCIGMGSHLVVVDTEAEQNFLLNWVKGRVSDQKEISNYCLGLNSQEVEGQWCWVDGTLYNKSAAFWMPEEPNFLNSEKCAVMQMGGNRASSEKKTWNNVRCSLWCHGICEAAAMKI